MREGVLCVEPLLLSLLGPALLSLQQRRVSLLLLGLLLR